MSQEAIEERNVSEAVLQQRFLAMEQLVTIIYCRDVFRDFRKPVEVMYPHLAATYHTVISKPMDLGTLLLKTMKREIHTINELRTGLQLVHKNALYFNEGAPLMEAVSKHLEHFSAGLFEEILRFPYHVPSNAGAKPVRPEVSLQQRLEKRHARLMHVREQIMDFSEVRRLLGMLSHSAVPVPASLQDVVGTMCAGLLAHLSLSDEGGSPRTAANMLSLKRILQPILQAAVLPPVTSGVPMLGAVLVHTLLPTPAGRHPIRSDCLGYIGHLEEQVGLLAVLMEERLLRGTPYSSIWAVPSERFFYAQSISVNPSADGRNRSPWWPCMVIAAGENARPNPSVGAESSASSAAGGFYTMPTEVMKMNLSRIPSDIVRQLNKLRPRTAVPAAPAPAAAATASSAATDTPADAAPAVPVEGSANTSTSATTPSGGSLTIPEGYLLLEYFGAHDFGWVKADSVYPMYFYAITTDGTIEVVKSPAPGKQAIKDSILEAEEAWAVLHRRRRSAGIVPRAATRTLSAARPPAASTAGGDDEDVALLTTADATTGADLVSQDSDIDEKDSQDLMLPPTLAELERSVAIPEVDPALAAAIESSVAASAEGSKPAKATAKASGSKRKAPSEGSSVKATPNLSAEQSAPSAGALPAVPPVRKHALAASSLRDDRRLSLASPEEIMRFRANVEYVLPQDLSVDDLRRCFEDGKFKTSLCPLPLPTMQSMGSPTTAGAEAAKRQADENNVIAVDDATRSTFRSKALMRTRAVSYYLNAVRPLHLEHYSATPSKKGFPPLPPSTAAHTAAVQAATVAAAAAVASVVSEVPVPLEEVSPRAEAELTGILLTHEDSTAKAKKPDATVIKIERRKPTKKSTSSAGLDESPAGAEAAGQVSSANIHIPANLTLSSSCFLLDAGCSRFAAGEGSVYTRTVDLSAKVFKLESKSRATRKRILRDELAALQAAMEHLQQVSQQRQMRENERKIRFQQLQQQQLQQQLQQQQYAMAAQAQHQQYLLKLLEQTQQKGDAGSSGSSAVLLPKKPPAKPKAPKAPIVNADGTVQPVPAPKSRAPKVAAPTSVGAGADDAGIADMVDAAQEAGTTTAAPPSKKKARPAEGPAGEGSAPKRPKAAKKAAPIPPASSAAAPTESATAPTSPRAAAPATPVLNMLASAAASLLEGVGLSSSASAAEGEGANEFAVHGDGQMWASVDNE